MSTSSYFRSLVLRISICAVALHGRNCPAALLVDQQNDVLIPQDMNPYAAVTGSSAAPMWQTFTVGLQGALARIDLGVFAHDHQSQPLLVEITHVKDDLPDLSSAGLVASRTVNSIEVPIVSLINFHDAFYGLSVDFSADDLQVDVGQRLAIVMKSNSNTFIAYNWWMNSSRFIDQYPGGATNFGNNAEWFSDAHFRTVVDVVPEPSQALLILIGIACSAAKSHPRVALDLDPVSRSDGKH